MRGDLNTIFDELAGNEISVADAVERVLYHPDFGGNRDDAEAMVDDWCLAL